jgi:hypothetical protein
MKPTIGRIVHYYEGDFEAMDAQAGLVLSDPTWNGRQEFAAEFGPELRGTNGTRWHPAIITQVWNDTRVNLTVFWAGGSVGPKSSALLLPDEAFADGVHCANSGWRWPPAAGR